MANAKRTLTALLYDGGELSLRLRRAISEIQSIAGLIEQKMARGEWHRNFR